MHTGNPELQRELLAELDEQHIWYNVVGDSYVEVEYKDANLIAEIFKDIMKDVLPRDRSIIPAPHLLGELIEALEEKNISCDAIDAFDQVWVVCSSDDMGVVNEILGEIAVRDAGAMSGDMAELPGHRTTR